MPKIISSIILISVLLVPLQALALESEQTPERGKPLENIWSWIKEKITYLYEKTHYLLSREVEQRKPAFEEEFKKEAQEMTEEIKKEAPSWWERIKNLIK